MRKLITLLTILVSSLGLIGVITPAASAANCAIQAPANIFYNGSYLQYSHYVLGCNDVDQVQLSALVGNARVGIVNTSTNPDTDHFVATPPTLNEVLCGRLSYPFTGTCTFTGYVPLWGCGPVQQTLYSTSQYRIHGKASQSWGPWHGWSSLLQTMNC